MLRRRADWQWLDPDQELINENKSDLFDTLHVPTFGESLSRGFRSILAVLICIVIPALLYIDVAPTAVPSSGDRAFADAIGGYRFDFIRPEPPPSAAPPQEEEVLYGRPDMDVENVDYAAALNRMGLLDDLSGPAVQALFSNRVSPAYLVGLYEEGLLSRLSFPALIAYYNNNIPTSYLTELDEAALLSDLSFPAVISFHETAVPLEYLRELKGRGYLSELPFPAVTAFYEKSIPMEFLDELSHRELLGKLSYPGIITMYEDRER